ncbi:aminoglycoside phosphotransferase family protein [Mycetocola zhadangensis]|uniref:aminoglycoside phosphotransferase family protein n=1 Tax=Mycetocola zhadangensis TaxID=1164595 RepID=UPI003A4E2D12
MPMHGDEIQIDAGLVSRLLADQFPEGRGMALREFRSIGTVNAIYRLGSNLLVRLPRRARWAADLDREREILPRLESRLPLAIPRPVFAGSPSEDYPSTWAIYEWINGATYSDNTIRNEAQAARDLASFVTELRRLEVSGAPPAGRRPLSELDGSTREAIARASGLIDAERALAVWDGDSRTEPWKSSPVWIHTDLLRPNLLAHNGRLTAVLDWGGAGVGDPAADAIAAWSVFTARGRQVFRRSLGVDDATWQRARAYALHQAALIIPYYRDTNPEFMLTAVRTVREVLADSVS